MTRKLSRPVVARTVVARTVVVRRDPPLDGLTNMAIDESLLAEAAREGPITIRLYRWREPTLSLGHFQTEDQFQSDRRVSQKWRLKEIPRVRRKTGGGAILHDQEWTYSIVIPSRAEEVSKGHSDRLYRVVHESIRDGLIALGWAASLAENCTCSPQDRRENEPFLCFQRRSPVDIVVGDSKLVGSAQRRSRTGLLQHGSVLLHSSPLLPELLGLEELLPQGGSPVDWPAWLEDRIRSGLRNALGIDC